MVFRGRYGLIGWVGGVRRCCGERVSGSFGGWILV